jgi:hypothetical protein
MEQSNNVRLVKIPLHEFISILVDLYEQGVDYIDIEGNNTERQDSVNILFNKEYMAEESLEPEDVMMNIMSEEEEYEEEEDNIPPINLNIKLSDEDLNQLS